MGDELAKLENEQEQPADRALGMLPNDSETTLLPLKETESADDKRSLGESLAETETFDSETGSTSSLLRQRPQRRRQYSYGSYFERDKIGARRKDNYEALMVFMLLIIVFGGISAGIYYGVLHHGGRTVFSPSVPRLGWQPSSGPRSTMDIITECASTMAVFLITAVHFDVPPKPDGRHGFRDRMRSGGWMIPVSTICIWLMGLFAPEAIVLWAMDQYIDTDDDVEFMRDNGCPQWTYKHAFFARMGGLRMKDGTVIQSGKELYELDNSTDKTVIKRFDYQALLEDINDKSKADTLAKLLAVLQITRFLCGAFARAAEHLPVSPLEYITSAYVVCTLLIFAFWFHKPYNAQEPIRVHLGTTYVLDPDAEPHSGNSEGTLLALGQIVFAILGCLSPFILGAGHVASWNVEFPNSYGQPLWRACSICMMVCPVAFVIGLGVIGALDHWLAEILGCIGVVVVGATYIIARFILLFLLVYSFWSLPAGVYDAAHIDWLNFIPFLH